MIPTSCFVLLIPSKNRHFLIKFTIELELDTSVSDCMEIHNCSSHKFQETTHLRKQWWCELRKCDRFPSPRSDKLPTKVRKNETGAQNVNLCANQSTRVPKKFVKKNRVQNWSPWLSPSTTTTKQGETNCFEHISSMAKWNLTLWWE